jgi:gas vesicle protein
MDQQTIEKNVEKAVEKALSRLAEVTERASKVSDEMLGRAQKTADEVVTRAQKTADDLELKDRLGDALAALTRTRVTQRDDSGVEKFMTGLLLGVAAGFGLALLLAPKSGEEMREDLMQKGIELKDRAQSQLRSQFGDGEAGTQRVGQSGETGIA